jgi:hypothetical protein
VHFHQNAIVWAAQDAVPELIVSGECECNALVPTRPPSTQR